MTPSEQAKAAGLRNLKHVSDITGQHPNTLRLWHKTKPELFEVVLAGCVVISERGSPETSPAAAVEDLAYKLCWQAGHCRKPKK